MRASDKLRELAKHLDDGESDAGNENLVTVIKGLLLLICELFEESTKQL